MRVSHFSFCGLATLRLENLRTTELQTIGLISVFPFLDMPVETNSFQSRKSVLDVTLEHILARKLPTTAGIC